MSGKSGNYLLRVETPFAHLAEVRRIPVGSHVRVQGAFRAENGGTHGAHHLRTLAAGPLVRMANRRPEEHLVATLATTRHRS